MSSSPRRWISGVVLLVVLATTTRTIPLIGAQAGAAGYSVRIARANAIADLDALFDAIERIHPDPYFSRSRELVATDRRQLVATLPETMTRQEWWMRLAPLVAALGDGHTEVPPPIAFVEQIASMYRDGSPPANPREAMERVRQFPGGSVITDEVGHLIVTSTTLAGGIARGDRILSINDRNVDQLLADWIRGTSGDSYANRVAAVAMRFSDLLSVHSIAPPYRLTVAGPQGGTRTASIAGTTLQSAIDARQGAGQNFVYRVLQPGIGYMDFYSMGGDAGRFTKALAAMFRQAAADDIRTLIVDLRSNAGGYSEFGDELLRYVTRTPFRSWSREELKRSPELRAGGFIPPPFRWFPLKYAIPDARRIYTGPTGSLAVWTQPSPTRPRPREPFFSGPVCILTGSATFSAAVRLADAAKSYHLATIVGEETGGRANMTMEPLTYLLRRSGLVASIASGRTVRANGDASDRSGIIPDIVVKTTVADIRDGRDPVLERASRCPAVQSGD